MLAYQTNIDICNRALQHLGANLITAFTDDTKSAAACEFLYDKVRQAELRRNVWRFAIRNTVLRPINSLSTLLGQNPNGGSAIPGVSMLLMPPVYDPTYTYPMGAIVADSNNVLWQSQIGNNQNGIFGKQWCEYFGSLVVSPYDTTNQTGYYPGELVYETVGPGQFNVFLALCYTGSLTASQSATDPSTYPTYNPAQTYYTGQVVVYNGTDYMCLQNATVGVTPTASPASWNNATQYYPGNTVVAKDGYEYTALLASYNIPPANNSHPNVWQQGSLVLWTNSFTAALGSDQWQSILAEVVPISIIYPVGSGPSWQSETKNVFLLPNGYLKEAPQAPKAGAVSWLGAPSGIGYNDWTLECGFVISQADPILVFKFIADVNEVPTFDPMFCEGLACRLAVELCETLTQSQTKAQQVEGMYGVVMREARTVNGIETGPTESPEDDYIQCRW